MISAFKHPVLVNIFSRLLTLAQSHLLDLLLAAIACWAVAKLHRRPRELWLLLAAIGLTYVPRGISANLFQGYLHYLPALTAAGQATEAGLLISGLMTVVMLVTQGLAWWCLLQVAFGAARKADTESEHTSVDSN